MKLLLFLLLTLIYSELFASTKIKVKQIDNIVKAHTLISSLMVGEEEAQRKNLKVNYISHIMFKIKNNILYSLYSSPYIADFPHLKFNFRYQGRGDKITLTTVDNYGKIKNLTTSIRNSKGTNTKLSSQFASTKTLEYIKINPEVWNSSTSSQAIKILYKKNIPIDNTIKVIVPKLSENSYSVRIRIITDLDLQSIAIFKDLIEKQTIFGKDLYDNKPRSTVAIFKIPQDAIIDYTLYVKLRNDSYITVVAKNRNGKLYKTVVKVNVWVGGANCS